ALFGIRIVTIATRRSQIHSTHLSDRQASAATGSAGESSRYGAGSRSTIRNGCSMYDGFRALCYVERGRGYFMSPTAMTFAVSIRWALRLRRRSVSMAPDPYWPRTRWLKIKNPAYTQKGGQGRVL